MHMDKNKQKKPEVIQLKLFGKPEDKKRGVIQKDVGPKAKGKLPYFKENSPKYAYAQNETIIPPGNQQIPAQYGEPAQEAIPEVVQSTQSSGSNTVLIMLGIFIFITIIYALMNINDGGGGFSSCPTSCDGAAIIIEPECSCPSDSRYHSTITNKQCIGCKQCVCR